MFSPPPFYRNIGAALNFNLGGIGRNAFGPNGGSNNNNKSTNGNSQPQTTDLGSGSSASASQASTSDGAKVSSGLFDDNIFGNQGINNNNNLNSNRANLFQFKNPFAGKDNFADDQGGVIANNILFHNPVERAHNSFGSNTPKGGPNSFRKPPSGILDLNVNNNNQGSANFGLGSDIFSTKDDLFKNSQAGRGGEAGNNRNDSPGNNNLDSNGPGAHGKRDTDNAYPNRILTGKSRLENLESDKASSNLYQPKPQPGVEVSVSPSNLEITKDNSEIDLNNEKTDQNSYYPGQERGVAIGELDPNSKPGRFPRVDNFNKPANPPNILDGEINPGPPINSGPYSPLGDQSGSNNNPPFDKPNRPPSKQNTNEYNQLHSNTNPLENKKDSGLRGVQNPKQSPYYDEPIGPKFQPPNQSKPNEGDLPTSADYQSANSDIYSTGSPSGGGFQGQAVGARNPSSGIPNYQSKPNSENRFNQNNPNDQFGGNGDNFRTPVLDSSSNSPTNQNLYNREGNDRNGYSNNDGGASNLGGIKGAGFKPPTGLDGSRMKEDYRPDGNVNFDGTSLLTDSDYLDRANKDR